MNIRVNGKEVLNNEDGATMVVLEKNEVIQLVFPEEGKTSVYEITNKNSMLFIKSLENK